MILFFSTPQIVYALKSKQTLSDQDIHKLKWLFELNETSPTSAPLFVSSLKGTFVGTRRELITPWSTNAVEITQNMGIGGIERLEKFVPAQDAGFDPLLQQIYQGLDQNLFTIDRQPDAMRYIDDIETYNREEGLSLTTPEVDYLKTLSKKLNRQLTDSEIFGFSQVNSEHCRHKIFNGAFILNGKEQPKSLFRLIKDTTQTHPNRVVSAYKDNCAFIKGSEAEQFAPATGDRAGFFAVQKIATVISLKAETHNFPTTVEPFNGAATGTGGEIRDRMAGGKGSLPLAGTAVYMTAYPRIAGNEKAAEQHLPPRKWRYQTPEDILIKASNGASDFGNKFGQPLICGSLLTFEQKKGNRIYGYDKVIMQAGGIGMGNEKDCLKETPLPNDAVVVLGGDNYRIGMGGGAVSSVATGEYTNAIELNAVQRSNPEMQKRVANTLRALCESAKNPIVSIHDHGAGGHLNCLSELVEATGGEIDLRKLPIGDPTLSAKEIIGNESQERMGLVIHQEDLPLLQRIADRERTPLYVVGKTTGNRQFTFIDSATGQKPIDLQLEDMFGNPPKTIIRA
jgi:phosphoribosylformylglycinamidine synthase